MTRKASFRREALEAEGFKGFLSFDELRETMLSTVPAVPGVYVVLRERRSAPVFLAESTGGHFKGKDPKVELDVLEANWIEDAQVLYFGKANVLSRRLREFVQFGARKPIGHRGGRLIWQLEGSGELLVAWKPTPDENPEVVERGLLNVFREDNDGRLPFANLR